MLTRAAIAAIDHNCNTGRSQVKYYFFIQLANIQILYNLMFTNSTQPEITHTFLGQDQGWWSQVQPGQK